MVIEKVDTTFTSSVPSVKPPCQSPVEPLVEPQTEHVAQESQHRKKFRFSVSQMRILKSHFATNVNPSAEQLMDIATEIDERLARVKVNVLENNYLTA